jgi:hypothetical protein
MRFTGRRLKTVINIDEALSRIAIGAVTLTPKVRVSPNQNCYVGSKKFLSKCPELAFNQTLPRDELSPSVNFFPIWRRI